MIPATEIHEGMILLLERRLFKVDENPKEGKAN